MPMMTLLVAVPGYEPTPCQALELLADVKTLAEEK
jgi:hypothetical protein